MTDTDGSDTATPAVAGAVGPRVEGSSLATAVTILLLAALLTWSDSAYRAQKDRATLAMAIAEQEEALAKTQPAQRQLNALASKTLRLARDGNESAAAVIEQLLAAGVTLTPSKPATTEK